MGDACTNCGLSAPIYDDDGRCPLCQNTTKRQNDAQQNPIAGRVATILKQSNAPQLTLKAAEAILEHGSARAAAKALGCNHGTILMALDGEEPDAAYKALGVRKTDTYTVAFHLDNPEDAERLRELFKQHGSTYREVARKLLSGELELRED